LGSLDGKVALVTGGANGLGLATCRAFAGAGARGVSADQLGVINTPPEGFVAVAADVTQEADLASAMASAQSRFGRLDIVVANAGVVPPWRETAALNLDEWDRVFAVNVRGVAATLKAAVPLMTAKGGAIVATASINSFKAHARQMLYTATKHAVWGIVKAAALDLGRHNIRVNAVAPGPIATEAFLSRVRYRAASGGITEEDALASFASSNALGRLATEDEVAATVVFLASDAASGITGQLLPVEAGLG
jgi:NAD(P)-dependent dehydrogenase (short-subunit alcohol dehydrogenase family)